MASGDLDGLSPRGRGRSPDPRCPPEHAARRGAVGPAEHRDAQGLPDTSGDGPAVRPYRRADLLRRPRPHQLLRQGAGRRPGRGRRIAITRPRTPTSWALAHFAVTGMYLQARPVTPSYDGLTSLWDVL